MSFIFLNWVILVPNLWLQWILMNAIVVLLLASGNSLLELFILKTQWYFFNNYYATGLFE